MSGAEGHSFKSSRLLGIDFDNFGPAQVTFSTP